MSDNGVYMVMEGFVMLRGIVMVWKLQGLGFLWCLFICGSNWIEL